MCHERVAKRQRACASLKEKVAALHSPVAYDGQPRSITAIETHFAWVFLTDDLAFKLKKPVRTAYLDLSAVSARRFDCCEEFRLNQKLARGVYLGVVPLTRRADGSLHVGADGAVVDWLVKMRRLPSALMLDREIAAGDVPVEALADVGRMLARFYRGQQRMDFEPCDYLARIRFQIREDRSDLLAPELHIRPGLVEAVAAAQLAACASLEQELMLRAQQRRIVEAHGDLRPEHICLTDPPCIIDSLEFSLDLRTLDPGEELAFLGVECTRLGGTRAAEGVLNAYRAESRDPITPELLELYRSRRATVRAKLVAWHLRDPAVRGLADWSAQAQEYLALAREYAGNALARGGQRR